MKRKILAIIILATTLMSTVVVSADTTIKPKPGDPTYKAEGESKMELGIGYYDDDGNFVAGGTLVSAVVPLLVPCAINPNSVYADAFVSADLPIQNTSQAPIKVKVKINEGAQAIPMVDGEDKDADYWQKLDAIETSSQITLGVKEKTSGAGTIDFWYKSQGEDKDIGVINPLTEREFRLQAKHGMAFPEGKKLDYKIIYTIELE